MWWMGLLMAVLVHCCWTRGQREVTVGCYGNATLPCSGIKDTSVFSVFWSKVNGSKRERIIRKSNGNISRFKDDGRITFGEQHSLLLNEATPQDEGTYECVVFARVGGTNHNVTVLLWVKGCWTPPELSPLNGTLPAPPVDQYQVLDLPLHWSLVIPLFVAVGKTALSLCIIWVCYQRSSRQQNPTLK